MYTEFMNGLMDAIAGDDACTLYVPDDG